MEIVLFSKQAAWPQQTQACFDKCMSTIKLARQGLTSCWKQVTDLIGGQPWTLMEMENLCVVLGELSECVFVSSLSVLKAEPSGPLGPVNCCEPNG